MPDAARHELILPDLGLGETPIIASTWLKRPGSLVIEGDRLLEVHAGSVTVDLPAPASGILAQTLVQENEGLHVGQPLAVIESRG